MKFDKIQQLPDIKSPQPINNNVPWITTEQYKIWVWVNGSSWSAPTVATIYIPTGVALWNYDLTSDEIGFTPSFINIKWFLDEGDRSWCDINIWNGITAWLYTVGISPRFTDNRAINLYDDASNRFQANFVEFIPWWLTVDITQNGYDDIVSLAVTAYK